MVQHGDMNQGVEMVGTRGTMARVKSAPDFQMASNMDDPARDHLQRNGPVNLGEMIHHSSKHEECPMRMGFRGGALRMRRNRSKPSFENSDSSNELQMPFELRPNKFEALIRFRPENFGFLRILAGRASNQFKFLRMAAAASPA